MAKQWTIKTVTTTLIPSYLIILWAPFGKWMKPLQIDLKQLAF
jgi:hypothetical protein